MSIDSKKKKSVIVREHPRRVPISKKNPKGITIVDRHMRYIEGQYLDKQMIYEIFNNYKKINLIYPTKGKLKITSEDLFDDQIAVWVDYFNKKIKLKDPIDPNMIKALIASESAFNTNAINKQAIGLTQITTDTLKILQDLKGESKDFVFKNILKKDLIDPNVSIALGTRWIAYKKQYAEKILKRKVTSDEVIKLYKGILKDKSDVANRIMKDYRKYYEKLNEG